MSTTIERRQPEREAERLEREDAEARRLVRLGSLSSAALLAEHNRSMDALDKLTMGLGDVAYLHANTARHAWTELARRGLNNKVLESDGLRRNALVAEMMVRI